MVRKLVLILVPLLLLAEIPALSQAPSYSGSSSAAGVTNVSGTTNQVNVATGTTTPVISLPSTLILPGSLSVPGNVVGIGTDNSAAGTLNISNGSANAHTVFGSAATTTNTILGPATAIANGHVLECSTSGTVCTLTDGGAPGTGTVNVNGAGSLTSTAFVTGAGTTNLQTPNNSATLDTGGDANFPGTLAGGQGSTFSVTGATTAVAITAVQDNNSSHIQNWDNHSSAILSYINSAGSFLPNTTNSIPLGGSSNYFSNVYSSALQCGIAGTVGCVITGAGATSGTATISFPAAASTTTNPITFSNAISAPSAALSTPLTPANGGTGGTGNTYYITPGYNNNSTTAVANSLLLSGIVIPAAIPSAGHLSFYVGTGDASHNSDVCLYSKTGTLVADVGAQDILGTASEVTLSISGGTVSIPAGTYYVGYTSTATTLNLASSAANFATFYSLANTSISTSGGACPGSITPPSDVWTMKGVTLAIGIAP